MRLPGLLALILFASSSPFIAPSLGAADLSLELGDSTIRLDAARRAALAERLLSYFRSCHRYSDVVVGETPPREDLERLWAEQEGLPHALLRVSHDAEAAPPERDPPFEVLFGFSSESGPWPVLLRDGDALVTSYIKCPGLEGLLLSCEVHGILPGMQPSPRCREWQELQDGS